MEISLSSLEKKVLLARNSDAPPLHLWQPPLSGDIDIQIDREGVWYHEGIRIQRAPLVNLFASILRRETDGEYYLVTPVEKWRIQVALHPLMVIDVNQVQREQGEHLEVVLNTGRTVRVDDEHPLSLDPVEEGIPVVALPHGLSALFSRAAWYRLVDLAYEEEGRVAVRSGNRDYVLQEA
ncbi:MAG: DUF1285 domain-containing protein [Pseudomonadota bacterium]